MERPLLAVGSLAALVGAAMIPPVVAARLDGDGMTPVATGVAAVGGGLIACGAIVVAVALRRRLASGMPSGARMAVTANILVLAFCALELSDRLVQRDGRLLYWTTFVLPPALLLFRGLISGRPWAWWVARGAAALGVVWFLGFLALVPFVHLQAEGEPISWSGRVYMGGVTVAIAAVLAGAFRSLGRRDTRNYFGLVRTGNAAPS